MKRKVLLINYKAYEEAFLKGVDIAKYSGEVSSKSGVNVIVSPPFTLLRQIKDLAETIAQGVDEVNPGAFTAHITWFELKNSGVKGTLINHSEKRYSISKGGEIDYDKLKEAINKCKAAGLDTYVCVQNLDEAREVAKMEPTAVSYEPPELIGGNISVSNSKPEIVKEFCEIVKSNSNSLSLIGAGIKGKEDAVKSVQLGSDGVLVASGIMKAENYRQVIDELIEGLTN